MWSLCAKLNAGGARRGLGGSLQPARAYGPGKISYTRNCRENRSTTHALGNTENGGCRRSCWLVLGGCCAGGVSSHLAIPSAPRAHKPRVPHASPLANEHCNTHRTPVPAFWGSPRVLAWRKHIFVHTGLHICVCVCTVYRNLGPKTRYKHSYKHAILPQ